MHSLIPQITADTTAPVPGVASDSLTSPHTLSVPSDHCIHDRPSTWGGIKQPDITPRSLFPQITVDTTAPLPGVVSDSLTSPHALSVPSDHCRHDRPSTWRGVRQPDITPCSLCSLRSLYTRPPLYLGWCQTA